MSSNKEELIKLLDGFDVETLTEAGIEARFEKLESEGLEATNGSVFRDLCNFRDSFRLLCHEERADVLPHMFSLIERAGDLEIGSGAPGPITHAIETPGAPYLHFLLASLSSHPTPSTLLMLNRWANGIEPNNELLLLLSEFEKAATHAKASELARREARSFLEYQKSRFP